MPNEISAFSTVSSSRILYTPSSFARFSLLHLQEAGSLQAVQPHTSRREKLQSYLCFVVCQGSGRLVYENTEYCLSAGDVVFIDCRKGYSHVTEDDLWSLRWCHFYGISMPDIYAKYRERGGKAVFHPDDAGAIEGILSGLYDLASSSDYVRDMRINEKLNELLTILMEQSWHQEVAAASKKRMELNEIKRYLDENYGRKVSLEDLANKFFVSKCYLSRIFKDSYGFTVNKYILFKRITEAKRLLRFSAKNVDEIADSVGMNDANYFSRMFRKVEGMSPSEYRKRW